MENMGYKLDRFLKAHEFHYQRAVTELKNGKKTTHWMWFIFPQLVDLGKSANAKYFGIENIDEACEYLAHPILGKRLRECCEVLLTLKQLRPDITAVQVFGEVDAVKLQYSMTLFALAAKRASAPEPMFEHMLHAYFTGRGDRITMELVG